MEQLREPYRDYLWYFYIVARDADAGTGGMHEERGRADPSRNISSRERSLSGCWRIFPSDHSFFRPFFSRIKDLFVYPGLCRKRIAQMALKRVFIMNGSEVFHKMFILLITWISSVFTIFIILFLFLQIFLLSKNWPELFVITNCSPRITKIGQPSCLALIVNQSNANYEAPVVIIVSIWLSRRYCFKT